MLEHLKELESYDPSKDYVVAKHDQQQIQIKKGRKLIGEIPDSSYKEGGTLQVWEIVPKGSISFEPQVALPASEEVVEEAVASKPETDPLIIAESEPVETKPKPKPKPSLRKRVTAKMKGTK